MTPAEAARAVAAGILLDLAFPPVGWWPLAPVAVAALVLSCPPERLRSSALAGGLAGLGFFLPLLHWSGAVAGAAAWVALASSQAAFFVPLGMGLALARRLPAWPVWSAAVWVLDEAARSRGPFGGLPWGRLAFAGGRTVWTPLAALGGAPLVSFAVALTGGLLAWLVRGRGGVRSRVAALAALLAAVALPALVPVPVSGTPVTVAVVQGNVPRLGLGFNAQRAAVLANHVNQTLRLAALVRAGRLPAPRIVVWPENSSDIDPLEDPVAGAAISAAARAVGVPVLVGAVLDGPGRYVRNAGIVWDPVHGPGQTYIKRHPVPFGEYIPFRSVLARFSSRVALVPRDFLAGQGPGLLRVGPVPVGDVICFEVAYDGLVRDVVRAGGRLIVVQTNNATFGRSGESPQQLAMSRLRAVESGRTVLVAATSGISAVIAPDGRLLRRAGVFRPDLLVATVPLRTARTLATRLGAWPELALSLAALAALALAWRRA